MIRRSGTFATILAVSLLVAGVVPAQQRGPTVYAAPDDATPFRRSDDTSLFRERRVPEREPSTAPARRLDHDLDLLGSRTVARPGSAIPRMRLERRLDAAEHDLRSLKTRQPNDSRVPILERRLDRLQRPTRLGR